VLDGVLSDRLNATRKLKHYLSESIQCHSGVPQGSHLEPASDLFENVSVLGYADDLKLFRTMHRGLPVVSKGSRPFGAAVINLI
jgi:hypothetical protein